MNKNKIYPENETRLMHADDILRYISGGRGVVKLEAPSGNCHYYVFRRPVNPSRFPDDVLFVYALHDFEKEFYLGMIERGQFRLTSNSRFLPDTDIVKGAYYIIRMAKSDTFTSRSPMKLYHEGMCSVCGRPLTDHDSLRIGLGRHCKKRVKLIW